MFELFRSLVHSPFERRIPLRGSVAFASLLVSLAGALPGAAATPADAPPRPNVVFILADDLGYSDTTLYGTTKLYETPNIQRLAARGMLFTNAYSASPMCSATRASIMTGQAPARSGLTAAGGHLEAVIEHAYQRVPRERAKRPRLRHKRSVAPVSATRMPAGSETLASTLRRAGYATGHFGKWHLGRKPYDPLHFGFDVDVPGTWRPGPGKGYIAPWGFPELPAFQPKRAGEHLEARMAREAIAFMEANRDRPFFLNYWAFSVHSPFDADRDLEFKYRRRIDPSSPQRNPTYAAMVEHFDDAVGELLDAIDRLGLAERTIIIFTSDNGGSTYSRFKGAPVTSNAPLRGGKAMIYEGGTRVPAIVTWPGHVAAGSHSDALLDSTDWYPTLLDWLGIEARDGQVFDGVSQRAALEGKPGVRKSIFCHLPQYLPLARTIPASSVRLGRWKLIRFYNDGPDQRDRFELYDLERDPGESRNLAGSEPDRAHQLEVLLQHDLDETGAVLPIRNDGYQPDPVRGAAQAGS